MWALRKLVSLLLLLTMVPATTALLTVDTLRRQILTLEPTRQLLEEGGFYRQLSAALGENFVAGLPEATPFAATEIRELAAEVVTPERTREMVDPLVVEFYQWLYGNRQRPELVLAMAPLKAAMVSSSTRLLKAKWESLPVCTPTDRQSLNQTEGWPTCRPVDAAGPSSWAQAQPELTRLLEANLAQIPDQMDLLAPAPGTGEAREASNAGEAGESGADGSDLAALNLARHRYQQAAAVAGLWWAVLLVGLVLLALLNRHHWYTSLGWVGAALICTGAAVWFLSSGVDELWQSARLELALTNHENASSPVFGALLRVLEGGFLRLAAGLRNQAVWLLGGGMVASALVVRGLQATQKEGLHAPEAGS